MEVTSHPPPLKAPESRAQSDRTGGEPPSSSAAPDTAAVSPTDSTMPQAPATNSAPPQDRRRRHVKPSYRRPASNSLALPVWERCRVARMMAMRWMSHLLQRPAEDQQVSIESYRLKQHRQKSRAADQLTPSASPVSAAETPTQRPTQTFLDAVRSQKTLPPPQPPAPPPLSLEDPVTVSSHSSCPPPASSSRPSYSGLELVPENTGSIPSLLHALREIALSCSSFEGDAAPPPSRKPFPPPRPGEDAEGDAKSNGVLEEQWRAVRSHFHTVRRLVLNQEELVEVLDFNLGADWRPDEVALAARAGQERGTEEKRPQSAPSAAKSAPTLDEDGRTPASPETASDDARALPQRNQRTPPTALNSNAPPFHSRTSVPPTADYSPTQQVTSFLQDRTTPTTEAAAAIARPYFPSTPPLAFEAPKDCTSSPSSAIPRSANVPSSAASSPSMTFHLESREDMLRRRNAAPNAFYSAGTHSCTSHYLNSSGPHSPPGTAPYQTPGAAASGANANLTGSSSNGSNSGGLRPKPSFCPGAPRSLPVSPILTYTSPVLGPQCPYDYILVIDFEATCEERASKDYLFEIIEFPVVLVDVQLQRVVAEFHRYVKPLVKTQLSTFCMNLTGIQQSDVDKAAPLDNVIRQFERWYRQTIPPGSRTIFAADGPMDFNEFVYTHSVVRQGIRFPQMFYQWLDVKQVFAHFFNCQQGKIRPMLEVLHRPFEGRLHSGIDDARNIASIVVGLLQWGSTFCEVPVNHLPLRGSAAQTPVGLATGLPTPLTAQMRLPPSTVSLASMRSYGTAPIAVDGEKDY